MKFENLYIVAALAAAACDPANASESKEAPVDTAHNSEHAELLQRISDLETDRQALQATLDKVNEVLRYLSVTKNGDLMVSGANLMVVNGGHSTREVNGKGNLIVGYNEEFSLRHERTGSHNLIVGEGHDYLGHSGIVAGLACVIEGSSSFAIGHGNEATSRATAIGGEGNRANGVHSSVFGKVNRRVTEPYSIAE